MDQDLLFFCESFYASHYVPVAIYENGNLAKLYSSQEDLPNFTEKSHSIFVKNQKSPAIYSSDNVGLYGYVKIKNSDYSLIIGPSFVSEVTEKLVAAFMTENAIFMDYKEMTWRFLKALPQITYNQFLSLVLFINLVVNGEKMNMSDYFEVTKEAFSKNIAVKQTDTLYKQKEDQLFDNHGTYVFERKLLSLVRDGEPNLLNKFLLETAKNTQLTEGKVAFDALRQSKNIFLGLVAIVSRNAAIPSGMDVEEAFLLTDLYSQECEKCGSIDAVKNLQFNMLMDFATRIEQQKMPPNVTPKIYDALQYIKTHVNQPIGMDNVVKFLGYSRAWVADKFSEQMGTSVSKYIMKSKLEESKRLLKYTDKSLLEISNYLWFSSQSYFQNMFKKTYGLTPSEYRKKHNP